jgi:hypothetical protein
MTFTVVRAVREPGPATREHYEKAPRLAHHAAPPIVAASMNIPCVDEVIRLDLSDFPRTIPGALE